MESNDKNQSSFGTFLDGYNARKLESLQEVMQLKMQRMMSLMQELDHIINSYGDKYPIIKQRAKETAESLNPSRKLDFISALTDFGQKFELTLGLIKRSDLKDNGAVVELSQAIAYEYVDAAKTIGENNLIRIALNIGEALV